MEAWRQELYLAHHGIKGQKWGVRNGPPYPLGAGKHSASEKKAGWRSSLNGGSKEESKSKKGLTTGGAAGSIKLVKAKSTAKKTLDNLKTDYREGLKAQYLERHNRKTVFHKPEGKTEADAEKFAEGKIKAKKALLIIGGVTVTALAAKYVHDNVIPQYVDRVLKEGTEFKRMTLGTEVNRAFYAARSNKDAKRYVGFYGTELVSKRPHGSDELVKQLTVKAKSAIKLASDKNATRTFEELYKTSDDFRETVNKRIATQLANLGFKEGLGLANLKSLQTDDGKSIVDFRKLYDTFNRTLTVHGEQGGNTDKVVEQFYDALKKKGYGAINDVNDQRYSPYGTKTATIVFDVDNVMKTAIKEFEDDDIEDIFMREADKRRNEILVSSLLNTSLGAIAIKELISTPKTLKRGHKTRQSKVNTNNGQKSKEDVYED